MRRIEFEAGIRLILTYGGSWNTKRIGAGLLCDPKWCAKVLGVHESKHGKDVVVELSYAAIQ